MRQILAADYDQIHLLSPSVEDWIGPEHPARFVREFVGALDLKALGLDTLKRDEGGVTYEPALLLSMWLYGYVRWGRSTRAGEAAAAAGLPAELHRAQTLREQVRGSLERVRSGEARHIHPLEPDAARMDCDGRNRFGYNAQAIVDAKAQVIVAAELTNAPNDTAQLNPMLAHASAVCEAIGVDAQPATLADGGDASGAQLAAAQAGHDVLTPLPSSSKDDADPYHAAHFRHDPQRRVVVCPQGRELPFHHVRERRGHKIEV